MYTHKATARLDIAAEGALLCQVEYVTGSAKEYNRVVAAQIVFGEHRRVFRCVGVKTVFLAKFQQRFFARADGGMPVAGSFREYQDAWPLLARKE